MNQQTQLGAAVEHSVPIQDVAENVYAKAKDVWVWGKGLPLVSIGVGITEAVASKAAEVAGTNLEKIDTQVKPKLVELDKAFFNPAIEAVTTTVMGAVGKTEEVVKPLVIKVLLPLGLIKNSPENLEMQ